MSGKVPYTGSNKLSFHLKQNFPKKHKNTFKKQVILLNKHGLKKVFSLLIITAKSIKQVKLSKMVIVVKSVRVNFQEKYRIHLNKLPNEMRVLQLLQLYFIL